MSDDSNEGISVTVTPADAAIVFRADGEIETYVPALEQPGAPVGDNVRLAALALVAISDPDLLDYIQSYVGPKQGDEPA
ncbi:MAG: hypothetical protein MI806_11940 [Minwuiales bacterium]|nr:hypothetical protein [Minwuiales bacterium]